jgi:hypothetical protein
MNLRCKVFRASDAGELEAAVNRFFGEELSRLGAVQFEEITQSEGPAGVTVMLWYSLLEDVEELVDDEAEYRGYDEGEKEMA